MISFSAAHTAPTHIDLPATPELRTTRSANGRPSPAPRRAVLFGCLTLFGVLTIGIAARSLDLPPLSECQSAPVRLALGSEATATMTTGAGAACAIVLVAPAINVADLKIVVAPQHGTATPRGRTGAIYRPDAKYRGDDSFEFVLRGRSVAEDGVAVVRVQVTVR